MGTLVVSNVSKAYKRYSSKWARVSEWLTGKPSHDKTWVLRDISFDVQPGEAVGIVGVNGAGKSTLLKIITGTTQPTTGSVSIQGRVAALLELGMGFHPDFTGRQNARIAAQLAGLSSECVDSLLPEIEEFADIGNYFDRPLRIYSSGMQARVAFAVATSSKPDILIVDEALSVGDMSFQAKCMQRMEGLLGDGVSILFVSHALSQVRSFCSKALYISDGKVRGWGKVDQVCDLFQNDLSGHADFEQQVSSTAKSLGGVVSGEKLAKDPDLRRNSIGGVAGGSLDLEVLNFSITNNRGLTISTCKAGDLISLRAAILANKAVDSGAAVGLLFADVSGFPLAACNTNYYDKFLPRMELGDIVVVEWAMNVPFSGGEFRIDVGIKPSPHASIFFDRVFCASTLVVSPSPELLRKNFGGYLWIDAQVEFEHFERQGYAEGE